MVNDMQDTSTSGLRFVDIEEFSNATDYEQCPISPSCLMHIRFAFYSYYTAHLTLASSLNMDVNLSGTA